VKPHSDLRSLADAVEDSWRNLVSANEDWIACSDRCKDQYLTRQLAEYELRDYFVDDGGTEAEFSRIGGIPRIDPWVVSPETKDRLNKATDELEELKEQLISRLSRNASDSQALRMQTVYRLIELARAETTPQAKPSGKTRRGVKKGNHGRATTE
jgi:hypothetical protein